MTAAMKFIKNTNGSGIKENLICIQESLPCLELIIGDLVYIKNVVDFLSENLPNVAENIENTEISEGILMSRMSK